MRMALILSILATASAFGVEDPESRREDPELSRLAGHGWAVLKPSEDMFDSGIVAIFDRRNRTAVDEFLKSKKLDYHVIQPKGDRAIAEMSYIENPFARQEVINAMRKSKLFRRVEAVHCTECGGNDPDAGVSVSYVSWEGVLNPSHAIPQFARLSSDEIRDKFHSILSRFVRDFQGNPSVDIVSDTGPPLFYEFRLKGLKNAVFHGENNWENVAVSIFLSKRLDRDEVILSLSIRVSVAPGSSRRPQDSKFEKFEGSERKLKPFGTTLAAALKRELGE